MSSKNADLPGIPRGRWSISRRLVSLQAIASSVILGLCLASVYASVVAQYVGGNNRFLDEQLNTLVDYLKVPDNREGFIREVTYRQKLKVLRKHYQRLLDEDGHTLVESAGLGTVVPPSLFPPPTSYEPAQSRAANWHNPDGRAFIMKSIWVYDRRGKELQRGVLQVAVDVTAVEEKLWKYRRNLSLIFLFGNIVIILTTYLVALAGLRPLQRITETVEQVSASTLDERILSQHWPEELMPLAVAFDAMMERLRDSFDRLSHCAANLAHELRTPVNNLMGEAEVALARERSGEDYRQVIESSMEEYERLRHMIEGLLFLSRAENKDVMVSKGPFDARDEVDKLIEFYGAGDEVPAITVEGSAVVCADLNLFRRAVSNLISNAIKYTPAEGRITVRLKEGAKGAEVTVADTGAGIEEEYLSRLYDRFFRADRTRQMNPHGTGLGLAIVKSVMDLHGGSVAIASRLGEGTSVTLLFPPSS